MGGTGVYSLGTTTLTSESKFGESSVTTEGEEYCRLDVARETLRQRYHTRSYVMTFTMQQLLTIPNWISGIAGQMTSMNSSYVLALYCPMCRQTNKTLL